MGIGHMSAVVARGIRSPAWLLPRARNHPMGAMGCVLLALIGLLMSSMVTATAQAQEIPAGKTITIVVPFAPGGPGDIVARLVATDLAQRLGQPVIVETKVGAGGLIASQAVANAAPNGLTLLLHSSSVTSNQALQRKPDLDVRKDLTPVTPAIFGVMGLLVNPSVPAQNLKELIAYGKANPGKMNFGSLGVGSQTHLYGEMFEAAAGIKMTHVAYTGAPEAMTAAVGNEVQFMVFDASQAKPQAAAGKLRLLAVGSQQRSSLMPDVPTAAESGLPGFSADFWFGFFAPRNTPPAITERLATEIAAILGKPEIKQNLAARGYETRGMTAVAFNKLINDDVAKWEKAVADAKIERQ